MMDTGYSIPLDDLDGPRLLRQEEVVASRRLDALCFPEFAGEAEQADAAYTPPRRGGMQVICHRGEPVSQVGIWHSQVSVYGSPLRAASIDGALSPSPGSRSSRTICCAQSPRSDRRPLGPMDCHLFQSSATRNTDTSSPGCCAIRSVDQNGPIR